MNEQTREVPQLSFRAALGNINADRRTVDLVWTTGARVLRMDWWSGQRFYEELSLDPAHVRMGRLQKGGAPLLDSHSSYSLRSVLGVVESATLKKSEGTATVRFSKRAEVEPIFQDVRDGVIRNVSVGYKIFKMEELPEKAADGLRVYRAIDWEPAEVSIVPMGADADAGIRSDSPKNSCVIITREESTQMNKDPGPAAANTTTPPAAEAPAPDAAALSAARAEGVAQERARAVAIRGAVRAAKLGDAFADDLIGRADVTIERARELVLTRLADDNAKIVTNPQHRGEIEVGEEQIQKWQRGASASIIARAGLGDLLRAAAKAKPDDPAFKDISFDPGEFRGMSLVDLARESLEQRGLKTRGMSKVDLVGKALTHRAGGQNTPSDFPILLESVMYKSLLAAYATTPDTWSRFCGVRSAVDFRAQNGYRLGSFSVLDSLNDAGEFKNKSIPDGEKLSYTVATKGNIIALSRKAIVNDDIGAFNDLASRFGRAAKLSIESDVYALILLNGGLGPTQTDAQPFFHANRANVNATGSAIGVTGIEADRVVMAAQKDPSGNEILDLRPAVILVPVGIGGDARVINDAQYDVTQSNKFQVPNKVRGLFRDVIDTPRLTGTRRYLLTDPAVSPAFIVAFLDGQQQPFMDSQEGWRVDGVEWKVRLDYAVKEWDPRAAVTNAGA